MNTNKNKISRANKTAKVTISLIVAFLFSTQIAFASEINQSNLINLINQERTGRGVPALKIDIDLNQAASLKSKDMINRSYFDHYAYGLSPWDFIKNAGYNYLYAGENLAMDFETSEGVVKAWMSSPTHRDNILNPDFTETGLGIVKGEYNRNGYTSDTTMISNMFGRKKPTIVKIFDYIARNVFGSF